MNPYRHLQTKIRALLASEAKMEPEERRANEWLLQVNCAGTKFTVGKGGVNTMFYQFGEDARKANYADWLLTYLDRLGAQPHVRYELRYRDEKTKQTVVESFWLLARLKKNTLVKSGMRVYGIKGIGDGVIEELVLKTVAGMNTEATWQPVKGKARTDG